MSLTTAQTQSQLDAVKPSARSAEQSDASFNRVAWLAAESLAAPIACVSFFESGRQLLVGTRGMPPSASPPPQIPDGESICHHVLVSGAPLAVADAAADARFASRAAVALLGMRGYLGVPLVLEGGEVVGTLCVADVAPRDWSQRDLDRLTQLSALCASEFSLREEIRGGRSGEGRVDDDGFRLQEAVLDIALDAVITIDHEGRVLGFNRAAEAMFAIAREQVIGQPMVDIIVPPALRAAHRAGFSRVVTTGEARILGQRVEVTAQRANGIEFPAELAINRLPVTGPPVFTAFIRDVSERVRTDAAIKESESRFRQLTENIHEVFWLAAVEDNRILYVSPAYEAIWGRPIQDLLLGVTPFLDTVHPEDRTRVHEAQAGLAGDARYNVEYRIIRPDGAIRTIHDRAFPVRDDQGNIVRYAGIAEDVSERHAADRALRESAARMERITANVPGVVFQLRVARDSGISFPYVSDAVTTIFGIDSVLARSEPQAIIDVIHAPDFARLRRVVLASVISQEPWQWEGRVGVGEHTRWIEGMGRPERQPDGSTLFDAILVDITQRKRAEEAIRYQAQLLDTVEQSVIAVDREARVTWWNRHAEQMYGYTAAEAMGRVLSELIVPPGEEGAFASWLAAVHAGASRSGDVLRMRKDGSVFLASTTVAPTYLTDGTLTGMVGVAVDATERRSLEQQLRQAQKMEAIGRLAGGVAHDFNNLLTVVKLHTELLLEVATPGSSVQEDLVEIKKAAARGAALTRQLLAFSRQQVLEPKELAIDTVVHDLERMLGRLIGEDVELVTQLAAGEGCVLADPGQVEQVIVNLALNARDAMPRGGVLLISTNPEVVDESEQKVRDPDGTPITPGHYITIEVRDTGTGMDAATRARIFEPFFTTKAVGEGSGLGLATVYGIVEQSGGFITVDSTPGTGSAFRVHLPVVERRVPIVRAPSPDAPARSRGAGTILLVEDEPAVRTLARRILTQRGYTVIEAANGREALEIARARLDEIDALVTDAVMPEMSGPELVRHLHEVRPGLRTLYMSGYTDDDILRRGELQRGAGFLQKPFSPDQLASALREVLESPVTE